MDRRIRSPVAAENAKKPVSSVVVPPLLPTRVIVTHAIGCPSSSPTSPDIDFSSLWQYIHRHYNEKEIIINYNMENINLAFIATVLIILVPTDLMLLIYGKTVSNTYKLEYNL